MEPNGRDLVLFILSPFWEGHGCHGPLGGEMGPFSHSHPNGWMAIGTGPFKHGWGGAREGGAAPAEIGRPGPAYGKTQICLRRELWVKNLVLHLKGTSNRAFKKRTEWGKGKFKTFPQACGEI
ncbi:hypothetical protein TNIN_490201 [Trichonephila inaurata madagascariensis]|uniref:Uncharacterized protein n=1 Tax=Trichonephila inaurata madagascariensis TaxID=2747483 RepID=A0A8X6IKP0_9ARAC|nr:hypothetical protein TNIN_490201 [Trichonephila inaurata madagascariensis]